MTLRALALSIGLVALWSAHAAGQAEPAQAPASAPAVEPVDKPQAAADTASNAPRREAAAPQPQATPAAEVKRDARARGSERVKVRVRSTVAVIDPSADVHDIVSELRARRRDGAGRGRSDRGDGRRAGGGGRGAGERSGEGHREGGAEVRPHHTGGAGERGAAAEARHEQREARSARSERRRETRGTRGGARMHDPERAGGR